MERDGEYGSDKSEDDNPNGVLESTNNIEINVGGGVLTNLYNGVPVIVLKTQ